MALDDWLPAEMQPMRQTREQSRSREEQLERALRGNPKPATITSAKLDRIIALLERIERRLGDDGIAE